MDRRERIGAGVVGVVGMLIIAVCGTPKSDISPEQEAAEHLRDAADCLDYTRPRILEVVDLPDAVGRVRADAVLSACGMTFDSYARLSTEAGVLAVEAVRRVDTAAFGRATNQIGLNRAIDSVIAGFERQADRLSKLP